MSKYEDADFSGWATRNDLRCTDGRTIRRDAFKHQDGQKVPLVYAHNHEDPEAIIGHGYLENQPEGVYFYGYFNNSEKAKAAKEAVQHNDVDCLSIWANQLTEKAGNVLHGMIKEVSLVLSGANMGATIVHPVLVHGDNCETLADEAYIYCGHDYPIVIAHADQAAKSDEESAKEPVVASAPEVLTADAQKPEEKDDVSIQEVLQSMTPQQLKVSSLLAAQARKELLDELKTEVGSAPAEDSAAENTDKVVEHADAEKQEPKEKTVQEVLDTMNDEQLKVTKYLVDEALKLSDKFEGEDSDETKDSAVADKKPGGDDTIEHSEGGNPMNFNAFEGVQAQSDAYLAHSDEVAIIDVAKKYGSLKEAMHAYCDDHQLQHDDLQPVSAVPSYPASAGQAAAIEALFPDYKPVHAGAPEIVTNSQAWVQAVLAKVGRTPFSKIRTDQADLRETEALRGKGYKKGRAKVLADNFNIVNRKTGPTTVTHKDALNRDDVVDITDFEYVDYAWKIGRMGLEAEVARGILIGDGRDLSDPEKIDEECVRPIWTDSEVYAIRKVLKLEESENDPGFGAGFHYAEAAEALILDAMDDYHGSGNVDMFYEQKFFNKMLLARDLNGRRLYQNKNELFAALDVNNGYKVPEFKNKTRTVDGKTYRLLAIIGNLADYNVGCTKGGEITQFTDFDIDFNQFKSLIETRLSGAVTRIGSFIVIEEEVNPQ